MVETPSRWQSGEERTCALPVYRPAKAGPDPFQQVAENLLRVPVLMIARVPVRMWLLLVIVHF